MAEVRMRPEGNARGRTAIALVFPAVLIGLGLHPAVADVSAVTGSAYGYSADITLFGGAQPPVGPTPIVTLPPQGSATPITGNAPSASVTFGPATIFSSGPITVSTQGTPGPTGSVTSSTEIQNVNSSGQEVFTASTVRSMCTAAESGVSGSTTIIGGTVQTSEGNPNVDGDEVVVAVPANPAPNTTINGAIETVGDNFQFIFNEQITNADGSLTVNAVHLRLLGPTAVGDLIVGQSVCGVTVTAPTTTTGPPGTTTSTVGGTTTTSVPGTTTTAPDTTTTAPPTTAAPTTTAGPATSTTQAPTVSGVSGGAYGFFSSISLFGGPAATRGPEPSVTLPSGGADPPITASAPTGSAVYGPANVFTSGPIEVSTGGTTGPNGSVRSSANITNVNTSGQEVFTAGSVASTCNASQSGVSGSTTITGGTLITSEGNPDADGDETTVDVPSNPAPNTSFTGTIESVGDNFRYVFNEQIRGADGSITVNAAHLYLLGPTAVGDLIVGQVRCALTVSGGAGGGGGGGGGGGAGGGGFARSGSEAAKTVALAAVLVVWGCTATHWAATARRRVAVGRAAPRR